MKQQQKLTLLMALFFLITFVSFGTIVLNEKKEEIFLPRIENKLMTYLKENYTSFANNKTTIQYKNDEYIMTVESEENKNLYFTIKYKNKEIIDTYKENYIEGKSYLTYLEKQIKKEIESITHKNYKVTILTTLDSMTSKIKERVITENNILSLKIYNLETEIPIETWNTQTITNEIEQLITNNKKYNIIPKNYTITITNKNDLYQSIQITNITENLLQNNGLEQVIDSIINNKETNILKQNNITYKNLN